MCEKVRVTGRSAWAARCRGKPAYLHASREPFLINDFQVIIICDDVALKTLSRLFLLLLARKLRLRARRGVGGGWTLLTFSNDRLERLTARVRNLVRLLRLLWIQWREAPRRMPLAQRKLVVVQLQTCRRSACGYRRLLML